MNCNHFYRILPNQAIEISQFERAFYQAFIPLQNDILIRKIWKWDDANRKIKLKSNYNNLVVLCWKSLKNHIKCGVVANLDNGSTQLSEFGFTFPTGKSQPHCEIVTLFTELQSRSCGVLLNRDFLRMYCIPFMHKLGYKSLYSTCAEKPLKTYLRWGWKVIDQTSILEEKRYLLHFDIEENLDCGHP